MHKENHSLNLYTQLLKKLTENLKQKKEKKNTWRNKLQGSSFSYTYKVIGIIPSNSFILWTKLKLQQQQQQQLHLIPEKVEIGYVNPH